MDKKKDKQNQKHLRHSPNQKEFPNQKDPNQKNVLKPFSLYDYIYIKHSREDFLQELENLRKKTKSQKKRKIVFKKQDNYLYKNRKLKKGIFLKKPQIQEIMYPFLFRLRFVNEFFKKN
jgi:hypothetical protein